jgi:hypothetical protein
VILPNVYITDFQTPQNRKIWHKEKSKNPEAKSNEWREQDRPYSSSKLKHFALPQFTMERFSCASNKIGKRSKKVHRHHQ